eukprot:TRINITY_DN5190_c0_g1_i12.p2 TRINITY_DN5190_c0_g1~~TRINITY_DN5190_c0_g1_i12.p2  ORF type:complete len:124 (-),score=21.19 TRINITY_DN5190_c0_g1_i12:106-477(-)
MMKKILIMLLVLGLSITSLTACTNKKNIASNDKVQQNQKKDKKVKIESESTKSLISILADLIGKEDKVVVQKIGEGITDSNSVITTRRYETSVLDENAKVYICLLYTSPSPRDLSTSRMPSSA